MKIDPLVAVREIYKKKYSDSAIVLLAGSVVRGEATKTSDLDLVVVYEQLESAYRESFLWGDWPVEAFVHDIETLRYFFASDRVSGVPSLPQMVSDGIPIPGENAISVPQVGYFYDSYVIRE